MQPEQNVYPGGASEMPGVNRENPANRPEIPTDGGIDPMSTIPSHNDTTAPVAEDSTSVENYVHQLIHLIDVRTTLENYQDNLVKSGRDGLDPMASRFAAIGLEAFDIVKSDNQGSDDGDESVLGKVKAKLASVGKTIMEIINKLIEKAKEYAKNLMSGLDKVKKQANDLMNKAKRSRPTASTELHDDKTTITLKNPVLLFAGDKFCLEDFKAEAEVIRFFVQTWPQYAKEQIGRLTKRVQDFDLEKADMESWKTDTAFIGKHESLVKTVSAVVLPGNKQVAFKNVALGPFLQDAEGAAAAPETYDIEVRHNASIAANLQKNAQMLDTMSKLFREESAVLAALKSIPEAVANLEGRRKETIWKASRDAIDQISKELMDLVPSFWPDYDPIVRHLVAVGNARNQVCNQELGTV